MHGILARNAALGYKRPLLSGSVGCPRVSVCLQHGLCSIEQRPRYAANRKLAVSRATSPTDKDVATGWTGATLLPEAVYGIDANPVSFY